MIFYYYRVGDKMKRKNKLLYFLTILVIIIIYLVIHLFGSYLRDCFFSVGILQPINNIRGVETSGYTVTASTNNLEETYEAADKNRHPGPSVLTFKALKNGNEDGNLDLKVCYYMYGSTKCDVTKGEHLTGSSASYQVDGDGMIVIVVLENGQTEKIYYMYLKDDTNRGYTVTASTNNLEKTYDKADKNRKPGPTSLLTFKPKNENELLDLKVCYYMYGSAKCDVNNGQQLTGSIGEYLVEGEGMIAIVVLEDGKDEVTYYMYLEPEDNVDFVYTEDKTKGNYIYLINQFPISDEVGRSLEGEYKTFDFKLKFNENARGVNYIITLEKLSNSDIDNSWVKVYLENEGKALDTSIRTTGRIKTYNEYPPYKNKANEIILSQGTLSYAEAKRGYKNYRLRMWITEDLKITNENYYESKTIVARINVYASDSL